MTLKEFLIEKGAFEKFEKNLLTLRMTKCDFETFAKYGGDSVSAGFVFGLAPEGATYWCKLHNEYQGTQMKELEGES